MLPSSLAFFVVALFSVGPIGCRAQVSTSAQCLSTFSWTDNSLGQSPCLVTAYLLGACFNNRYSISALPVGDHYAGPWASGQSTCGCSSVTYNAISACAACQGGMLTTWSDWNFNCTTVYPAIFPAGVPSGTAVPQWAYQDVTSSNVFNVTLAQAVGDTPESTPAVATPTETRSTTSSTSPASTSPASTTPPSNTAVIVGGVVGGIGGLVVVAGLVFWFIKRGNRPPPPPPPAPATAPATAPAPVSFPPPPEYQPLVTEAVYTDGAPFGLADAHKP